MLYSIVNFRPTKCCTIPSIDLERLIWPSSIHSNGVIHKLNHEVGNMTIKIKDLGATDGISPRG
jgi:hypothetical protein